MERIIETQLLLVKDADVNLKYHRQNVIIPNGKTCGTQHVRNVGIILF